MIHKCYKCGLVEITDRNIYEDFGWVNLVGILMCNHCFYHPCDKIIDGHKVSQKKYDNWWESYVKEHNVKTENI